MDLAFWGVKLFTAFIPTTNPKYPSLIIIIIIKRRSGINPIPPTVKDRDYKKKQKQRKKINC